MGWRRVERPALRQWRRLGLFLQEPRDRNNDGVIDLLLGNADGTVSYYEGYWFAFTAMTAQPSGQRVFQWNSAPFLSYSVLAGPSIIGAITNRVATNLPSGGKTTCWTNSCGDAQQFYRLQIAQ